jgi:hypothetical protein
MNRPRREGMDQARVSQGDSFERIIVGKRGQNGLGPGKVTYAGRSGCSFGNEWCGIFLVPVINCQLITRSLSPQLCWGD